MAAEDGIYSVTLMEQLYSQFQKLSTHDHEECGQHGVLGVIGIFVSAHHANRESKVSEAPGLGTVSEVATVEVIERLMFLTELLHTGSRAYVAVIQ